jgi:hypothetical protein
MKEFTYKVKSEGFEGVIKLLPPSFSERLRYVSECKFDFENGAVKMSSENANAISKMVDYAKEHIKSVNVKHKNGSEAKSFDDLYYDNAFDSVIMEISSVILSGVSNVGELKRQK